MRDGGPGWRKRFGPHRRRVSLISRADRARDARQWDTATDLYRKALDRNPENPPIWVQYGHALKESGHLAEAEDAYRAAIARDAAAAEPRLHLGHVLKMQGRREAAQAAYLQAVALQPSMSEALPELDSLGWPAQQVALLAILLGSELPTEQWRGDQAASHHSQVNTSTRMVPAPVLVNTATAE